MGKKTFSWKGKFFTLLIFGCIRANGQTETLSANEPLLQNVDVGNSTGNDLTFRAGSEASFGCSYIGTANVNRMRWTVLTVTNDQSGYMEPFAIDQLNGCSVSQTQNSTGEIHHWQSIVKIANVRPEHDQTFRCIFTFNRTEGMENPGIYTEDLTGALTFRVKVFSRPTAVYVHKVDRNAYHIEDTEDWTFEQCYIDNIYPIPDSDSIGLYSQTTGIKLEMEILNDVYKARKGKDGLYDVTKLFILRPAITLHNESYDCMVKMMIGNITTKIKSHNSTVPIMIIHPPKKVKLNIHPNPVAEGEKVTLTCECDGYPQNSIKIYRKDSHNRSESWHGGRSNFLHIEFTANKSMNGTYICEANNVNTEVNLILNWNADNIKLWKDDEIYVDGRDIDIVEGVNLTLNCEQEGNPQPLITWDVTMDGKSYIKFDDWRNGIVIRNATIDDSGIYRCKSSLGLQRGIKVIVGTCKPQISIMGRTFDNGSVTLNVTCSKEEKTPACNLKLGTEYNVTTESVQVKETSSISKIYHLSEIDDNKQFWCKTSTPKGFELSAVYNSVDDLSTTTHTNTIIGVTVMILTGCILIVFVIYLVNHFFSETRLFAVDSATSDPSQHPSFYQTSSSL